MKLFFEWGTRSLNKRDEELCGDSMYISKFPDSIIFVLSDGLGSGVKASILSTMTTKIASQMLKQGLPIEEVVDTVSNTLPVCQVRKIAYSTFSISQIFSSGKAIIYEYDTPEVFFLRNRRVQTIPYEEVLIGGRKIRRTTLDLLAGDWLIYVSDGALNAGIGGVWSLGWGWSNISKYLENHTNSKLTALEVADDLARVVSDLYDGKPGDDVSIAVFKIRKKYHAVVMSGPPENKENDEKVVGKLMNSRGVRIVCGGTTSSIVSRILGKKVIPNLSTITDDVPPMGHLDGIDLVTEGVLTLTKTYEFLKERTPMAKLELKKDAASALTRYLLSADHIQFLIGRAINPAHQDPKLPVELALKNRIIHEVAEELREMGKEVKIEVI